MKRWNTRRHASDMRYVFAQRRLRFVVEHGGLPHVESRVPLSAARRPLFGR